ncbi:MAG TPA: SIR2 family protein [Ideonella sp.]|uniref:SIR2 family NAD-dependent protein deacylase n=1 Tax=Ideonella sp. TaxID=1929293 RepID=UPI002C7D6CA5|nr:SIR2 family protein [Ideonella sp.]HSI48846.1 SIR2 family protein [Ideonella sp.]
MITPDTIPVLRLSDTNGKDFLRGLLLTGRCIPFIGAGFTAGDSSLRGTVPGGSQFLSMMRKAINATVTANKPSPESLEYYTFQQVADEYFREPIVPLDKIKTTLRDSFTGVSIASEAKKAFLRWEWEYFYTLNIDDAIERELGAIKVLPFTEFAQHKTTQFVYKLHGDAADAITAGTAEAMRLVFGSADYVASLIKNRALISTLTNDLAERHLIFVGCSLTDELDILFALSNAKTKGGPLPSTNRVYVTANEPLDYESRKKLRQYGITNILVVDYADFYAFVASVGSPASALNSPLDPYRYDARKPPNQSPEIFLKYLLQIAWNTHQDSTELAITRDGIRQASQLLSEPMAVLWGRRFSGRTTLLFAILAHHSNRKRFFVPTSAATSDRVLNAILRTKDALIAVDAGAVSYRQLQLIVRKLDQIQENNTTVVISTNRAWLSALGPLLAESAFEVKDKMSQLESKQINAKLEPFGLSKSWRSSVQHLENIFSLSESPVVSSLLNQKSRLTQNISRLHEKWSISEVGKLEFSVLFYLGTRQRIYSRYFREFATDAGLSHISSTHFADFAQQWEPFIELEDSDPSSRRAERSMQVMVANASAWIHYSIQKLSLRLGAKEAASQIVRTFEVMNKIEDKAFELLLFDNLNAIYAEGLSDLRASVIREVYERLAPLLSGDPDYWLQRAKSFYYLSNQIHDLIVGVEYCEKSIVKKGAKTSTNAKLTKSNLLGKICKLKRNVEDSDIISAVGAYVEAIESRADNPLYIDELLRKSKTGKSYMSLVCRLASRRATLLPHKHEIELIQSYISGRF